MADPEAESTSESERSQSYVIFRLGGEGYALEVMRVQGVLDVKSLTRVPGGPKSLRGMLNLRGQVVPVYDLRVPFELPADGDPGRAPSVLIIETTPGAGESRETGFVVDRVEDVHEFAPEEIQPPPRLGLGKATPFVRGLIRHQDGFLLVLDVDRVFRSLNYGGDGGAAAQGGGGF